MARACRGSLLGTELENRDFGCQFQPREYSPIRTISHHLLADFSSFRMLATLRLGGNCLHPPAHFFPPASRCIPVTTTPRFIPSCLDAVEDIEDYQPGGYHPISLGDTFDHGRFKVLHKLGFGGFSTVWLARDRQEGRDRGRLVTLKAMRADASSSKVPSEIPELAIPQKIRESSPVSESSQLQIADHHFLVPGPNGTHLFLIFPLAGPSIHTMYDSPGRTAGSRRLRGDLARKVAKQIAMMIRHMHCAGIVHGGK